MASAGQERNVDDAQDLRPTDGRSGHRRADQQRRGDEPEQRCCLGEPWGWTLRLRGRLRHRIGHQVVSFRTVREELAEVCPCCKGGCRSATLLQRCDQIGECTRGATDRRARDQRLDLCIGQAVGCHPIQGNVEIAQWGTACRSRFRASARKARRCIALIAPTRLPSTSAISSIVRPDTTRSNTTSRCS